MGDLLIKGPPKLEDESGSDVKRFLTTRGTLLVKEFRDVNTIKLDYGYQLNLSTAIIKSMQRSASPGTTTFGVRFEHFDPDQNVNTAFLDYDETEELIAAIECINKMALEMTPEERDYVEVNFITKDGIKFGFYRQFGQNQAFMYLSNIGDIIPLTLQKVAFIGKNVEYCRQYLISKGAPTS